MKSEIYNDRNVQEYVIKISSISVSNCLWNVIYRKRMSILQLKSMHHTGWMNNMIWKYNITQYLISVHYTYHASLYSWEIYTLYMIHIVQVKHPLQKFPDKKLNKNINIKRDITLESITCIGKWSGNVNFT